VLASTLKELPVVTRPSTERLPLHRVFAVAERLDLRTVDPETEQTDPTTADPRAIRSRLAVIDSVQDNDFPPNKHPEVDKLELNRVSDETDILSPKNASPNIDAIFPARRLD
jgi:hypothetical protein